LRGVGTLLAVFTLFAGAADRVLNQEFAQYPIQDSSRLSGFDDGVRYEWMLLLTMIEIKIGTMVSAAFTVSFRPFLMVFN
jgi:hypothetical protein